MCPKRGWRRNFKRVARTAAIETEVARAFDNVTLALNTVGLDWVARGAYPFLYVPEADGQFREATAEMARQFRIRMPIYKPIWDSSWRDSA